MVFGWTLFGSWKFCSFSGFIFQQDLCCFASFEKTNIGVLGCAQNDNVRQEQRQEMTAYPYGMTSKKAIGATGRQRNERRYYSRAFEDYGVEAVAGVDAGEGSQGSFAEG